MKRRNKNFKNKSRNFKKEPYYFPITLELCSLCYESY